MPRPIPRLPPVTRATGRVPPEADDMAFLQSGFLGRTEQPGCREAPRSHLDTAAGRRYFPAAWSRVFGPPVPRRQGRPMYLLTPGIRARARGLPSSNIRTCQGIV